MTAKEKSRRRADNLTRLFEAAALLSNLIVTYKFTNIFKNTSKLVNIDISTEQKHT